MATTTTTNVYGKTISQGIKKNAGQRVDRKNYGLKYPPGKNLAGGFFAKESGVTLVKSNLKQLLTTEKGERVMLPNFGVNLRQYVFEPLDQHTFNQIKDEILFGINNYAPNVKVLKLQVFPDTSFSYNQDQGIRIKLLAKLEPDNQIIDTEIKVG